MQFRLRTMLVAVSIIAALIVAVPVVHDRLSNRPSTSLSAVVNQFNESTWPLSAQPKITEAEIIAEINLQYPTLVAAVRDKQILKRIVEKRMAPSSTLIECVPVGQDGYVINLTFRRGANSRVPKSGVPFALTLRK